MKHVLIFDHFLFKSVQSLDLISSKKKDNYIISRMQIWPKISTFKAFLAKQRFNSKSKLKVFGWNTLEMICIVGGLTHPLHGLPIYLNLLGKIHIVIVDFCTYTRVSYIFGCFLSSGFWNCIAFKFQKGFRTKPKIGLKLQRWWQWT